MDGKQARNVLQWLLLGSAGQGSTGSSGQDRGRRLSAAALRAHSWDGNQFDLPAKKGRWSQGRRVDAGRPAGRRKNGLSPPLQRIYLFDWRGIDAQSRARQRAEGRDGRGGPVLVRAGAGGFCSGGGGRGGLCRSTSGGFEAVAGSAIAAVGATGGEAEGWSQAGRT